jgi:signal recognition particle receptor subunit beta
MATLDVERGVIVVRIVYDGPAMSGKTTSLRSLAASLGGTMFSAQEAEGRTLFFDWLDYTGGRFNGYPIRCQLVSVPGQRALRSRRERILQTADAVVFVADTRSSKVEAGVRMARDLQRALNRVARPSPGVVVQANKRDDPDAVTLAELRQAFEIADYPLAFMETTATNGAGIRETFIFAVRLALDRVRELVKRGALGQDRPSVDSGEAFLAELVQSEAVATPAQSNAQGSVAAAAFAEALRQEDPEPPASGAPIPQAVVPTHGLEGLLEEIPDLPTARIPGGMIWPPVGGRILLQGALSEFKAVSPQEGGAWAAVTQNWRLHSYSHDAFESAEPSRIALVDWARLHVAWSGFLSQNRCIVSAPSSSGSWRLWQIVGSGRSLSADLHRAIATAEPGRIAAAFLDAAEGLTEACHRYSAIGFVPSLNNLTSHRSGGAYLGLAPSLNGSAGRPSSLSIEEVLRQEFIAFLGAAPELDVPRVLSEIARQSGGGRTAELLSLILIGH